MVNIKLLQEDSKLGLAKILARDENVYPGSVSGKPTSLPFLLKLTTKHTVSLLLPIAQLLSFLHCLLLLFWTTSLPQYRFVQPCTYRSQYLLLVHIISVFISLASKRCFQILPNVYSCSSKCLLLFVLYLVCSQCLFHYCPLKWSHYLLFFFRMMTSC